MAGTREILDDADTNWVKVPYQVVERFRCLCCC